MARFFEHLKLNWKFINSNKRLAIVTIIGLSISIAMITQNLLFLNTFRHNAFQEFAENSSNVYLEAEMHHIGTWGFGVLDMMEASVGNLVEELGMAEEKIGGQEWIAYKFFYLMLFNEKYHENEFHDTYLLGLDDSYLGQLAPFTSEGEAPTIGEFCIVTNSKTLEETNLALNDTFDAYVPVDTTENPWNAYSMGLGRAGRQFQFTGIINIDELSFGGIAVPAELQNLFSMALSIGSELIICDTHTCITVLNYIDFARNDLSILGRIFFDLQAFNAFKLDEEINQLQVFVYHWEEDLRGVIQVSSDNYELSVTSRIIPLLANFKRDFRIFQIFLLVFMLPTLGMALALTGFASNLVKKRRDIHIHNLHQRGASRRMLFVFMALELIAYTILAIIAGVLLGWPYTFVGTKSDGFFSFGRSVEIPEFAPTIIWICVGIGFGISFLSNVGGIWNRTKASIEEAMQEQVEKKPLWERFFIDVFLLVLGIVMWLVASPRIGGGSATALEFAFFFAAPAPILIITGTIMFATRIYPSVVKVISDILFKIPKIELNAVSARNAIRRKASTNRTIILLTITFALTVASVIVPNSYIAYDREGSYYNLGADIVVYDVDALTPTSKEKVLEIEGVEMACYVAWLELSNAESDLLYQIKVMGTELENFSKVAFEEAEYTNGRGMSNVLQSINATMDVIGQRDQMSLLALDDNATFVIKNWGLEGSDVVEKMYPVNFVDSYEYWPRLYLRPPDKTSKEVDIGIVGNITLPYIIARYDYDVKGELYVKVEEGYGIDLVANEIERRTQYLTSNIEEQLLISEGSLKATVLYGALNSSFIISMLITAVTLITLMLIQAVEREKEVAILKSLGISPVQLFRFFITEAIIVLVFTMILGVALGLGTSIMVMKILRIGSVFPPHEMIFPVTNIVWTTLAVFASGLLSATIPVIINSRRGIGGALKTI